MFLIINAAESEKIIAALAADKKIIKRIKLSARHQQSEKLLLAIDRLIKQYGKESIKGVAVISGPGSFTALRVGIAIANTLAWILKIPLVGIKLNEFNNLRDLIKIAAEKLKKTRVGEFVEPFYGQEPNITLAKSK